MTRLEMVQEALDCLGETSAAELAAFVQRRHGVEIQPAVISVIRASLREKEMLARFHQEAKAMVQRALKVEAEKQSA